MRECHYDFDRYQKCDQAAPAPASAAFPCHGRTAMRKAVAALAIAALTTLGLATASAARADSPHFTYAAVTSASSASVTAAFKEAGLGNSLDSVTIVLTGTAQCINPGGNQPQAVNKTAFSVSGVFGVSNGNATGTLTASAAAIDPQCVPPMTVQWTGLEVSDAAFSDSVTIPGTF